MEKIIDDIKALDREILDAEHLAMSLKTHRATLLKSVRDKLAAGGTTGDRIRDMVIRAHGSLDPGMESRLRTMEARMIGRAGELVAFSFALERCTRHVMFPRPGFENVYETSWYVACGLSKDERLRLQSSSEGTFIVLPVETYVWSLAGSRGGFERKPSPFKQWDRTSPGIDMYADAPATYVREGIFLCVGDDDVKSLFAEMRLPNAFTQCCELLGKLVLTPE